MSLPLTPRPVPSPIPVDPGSSPTVTPENFGLEILRLEIAQVKETQLRLQDALQRLEATQPQVPAEDAKRREKAETDKLEQEVVELKTRIKYAWSNWMPPLVTLITVLGALGGAWRYFDEQRRSLEFQMTEPMLRLADKLSQKDSQETAALLLSAYEKYAVPVLLKGLATQVDNRYLAQSLELIKTKTHVNPKQDVVEPLLAKAKQEFEQPWPADQRNQATHARIIANLAAAVGSLASEEKDKAVMTLQRLHARIAKETADKTLDEPGHFLINEAIEKACRTLLDGKECAAK